MAKYTVYQCSICRRSKSQPFDNIRVAPNHCTLTKGCDGRLFKIGETSTPVVDTAPAGLIDWYPRGQKQITDSTVVTDEQAISLTCSSTGAVVLAIRQTYAEMMQNQTISVRLLQRRLDDITYQQFTFKLASDTNIISGQDLSGKNLRFDQLAIDENRIFVRVNGVSKFAGSGPDEFVLTPNTVTFNSVLLRNSIVDISVYVEKEAIARSIIFNANHTSIEDLDSVAWGNIRWMQRASSLVNDVTTSNVAKWWIYTCTSIVGITPSSRLRLQGIYNSLETQQIIPDTDLQYARFLLASYPYENLDRYLNLYVDCVKLHQDYNLTYTYVSFGELVADSNALAEVYPPMQLLDNTTQADSSYIKDDVFSSTVSSIQTDTALTKLKSSKIIGPI